MERVKFADVVRKAGYGMDSISREVEKVYKEC